MKSSYLNKFFRVLGVLSLAFGLLQLQYADAVVFGQESEPTSEPGSDETVTSGTTAGDTEITGAQETDQNSDETASEGEPPADTESQAGAEETNDEETAAENSEQEEAPDSDQYASNEPTTEGESSEAADVSETVEVLAESQAVLVDENDEPLNLASNDAVDALATSDPYFTRAGVKYCYVPTGETPHPSLGCDVEYDVANPIQAAIDDVNSNGLPDDNTITVEPGTYEENVVINIGNLILYGDPGQETQDGADNSAPVLDGSTLNGTGITINADNVSIIGFILQNFDIGIEINDAGDVLIKDNTLEDNKVGIKINNTSGSTKKVELYGNVVQSSETDSVGLHVLNAGPKSVYGSLNNFLNEDLNVKDESGREDMELYFNQWGYWDGGSYVVCTLTDHTDADFAGLYTCARVEGVNPAELFLDGSVFPDAFNQEYTKVGEFCVDEKNTDYAVRTETGPGPFVLSEGESLSFVAVKQATGCYYQYAPVEDGPENSVLLDVNGVEDCIEVTRTTNPETGQHTYTFEVVKDEGGCGISHVIGYYDPIIEEEPECENGECEKERYDLILDPYCVEVEGEAKLAWAIINPNDFGVQAEWTLDGAPGSGTLAPGTTFIGYTDDGPATHTLNVAWEWGEDSSTSSVVCAPVKEPPPEDPPLEIAVVEDFLIPVTGAELNLQGAIPFASSLVIGLGLFIKGLVGRKKE